MSYLVLVALSLLWLAFFLPSLLQSRRTSSPYDSATSFQQSLTRISNGRAVTSDPAAAAEAARPPRRSRRQIARQRDVLMVLSASVAAAVVIGIAFGGPWRLLIIPTAVALITYVALLRLRVVQSLASARTRSMTPPTATATPPPTPAEVPLVVLSVRQRDADAPAPDEADLDRIAG